MDNMVKQDRIQAAFFDIDGTLVGFATHRISDSDIAALDALRASGVKIFIATGRHVDIIDNIPCPIDGSINNNGALVYMATEGPAVISRRDKFVKVADSPIPTGLARSIAGIIRDNSLSAVVFSSEGASVHLLTPEVKAAMDMINVSIRCQRDVTEVAGTASIYSFCVFAKPSEEEKLFGRLFPLVDLSRWCDQFCDINIKGMNKAVGIERVADALGIDIRQTIAFGDGGNDIPMISRAGIGVAMGNSSDDVKAAADYITASVDESGISKALHNLGLI